MDVVTEVDGEMAPHPARLHPGAGRECTPLAEGCILDAFGL
jgi:hypothetical protein